MGQALNDMQKSFSEILENILAMDESQIKEYAYKELEILKGDIY